MNESKQERGNRDNGASGDFVLSSTEFGLFVFGSGIREV
jgi:hypothetical protein